MTGAVMTSTKTDTTLKLWLIRRTDGVGYDEYDADVVVAKDEKSARNLSHVGSHQGSIAEIIGTAIKGTKEGVILGSFNAG
jgi:hypothetical protein